MYIEINIKSVLLRALDDSGIVLEEKPILIRVGFFGFLEYIIFNLSELKK